GREMAALPAPVGPGAGEAVEDLGGAGLAGVALGLGKFRERFLVRDRTPEELGHALLADPLQRRGNAALAEVFLGKDIGGDLAPALRHLDVGEREDDRAVRIPDLEAGALEGDGSVSPGFLRREAAFDLHFTLPLRQSYMVIVVGCGPASTLRGHHQMLWGPATQPQ